MEVISSNRFREVPRVLNIEKELSSLCDLLNNHTYNIYLISIPFLHGSYRYVLYDVDYSIMHWLQTLQCTNFIFNDIYLDLSSYEIICFMYFDGTLCISVQILTKHDFGVGSFAECSDKTIVTHHCFEVLGIHCFDHSV